VYHDYGTLRRRLLLDFRMLTLRPGPIAKPTIMATWHGMGFVLTCKVGQSVNNLGVFLQIEEIIMKQRKEEGNVRVIKRYIINSEAKCSR
jgi:hypothetical protein